MMQFYIFRLSPHKNLGKNENLTSLSPETWFSSRGLFSTKANKKGLMYSQKFGNPRWSLNPIWEIYLNPRRNAVMNWCQVSACCCAVICWYLDGWCRIITSCKMHKLSVEWRKKGYLGEFWKFCFPKQFSKLHSFSNIAILHGTFIF